MPGESAAHWLIELDENLPAHARGMAEELKRCTHKGATWRCPNWFAASDPFKKCAPCRKKATEYARAHRKTPAGKATQRKYGMSEKGKASARKYNRTDKQKAKRKVYNDGIMNRLRRSMNHMIAGNNKSPHSIPSRGIFVDAADARRHFESTFEDWMTWKNIGVHRSENGYNCRWQIGHRLPVVIFDASLDVDVNKCFDRRNLFAQCAKQNMEYKDKLVLSDSELLDLRELWPTRATSIESLKALFVRM